jgi:hypothetical protein
MPALTIALTDVDTEAKLPLGFEVTQEFGPDKGLRTWVYVFNDDANPLAQGTVVIRDAATETADGVIATTSAPANRVLGVAQHAIPSGSYGFILRRGIGEVLAGTGTLVVDEGLYVDATDAGTAMKASTAVLAAASAITEAHLAGPFGTALDAAAKDALATCVIDCRG